MSEIKQRRVLSQILTCFIFIVLFSKYYGFVKKTTPQKNVIFEKELDCINRDDIGNLEDSPRLLFIDEECGNLIVVNDGEERTGNISQKKSDVLQQPIDAHSVTNVVSESISSVTSKIFIGNQLGKNGFSCDFFTTK